MSVSHDEMIAVIEHHKNGGKVEYRGRSEITWKLVQGNPLWNFASHDYRIKPEPRSLWVVRNQSGNLIISHETKDAALFASASISKATIHQYKEVLP